MAPNQPDPSTGEFDVVEPTTEAVAERAGVSVGTLRRWVREGVIPQYEGTWTPAAAVHARIVAQLREAGNSLADIKQAAADGRLVLGQVDDLFPSAHADYSMKDAAERTGLSEGLIERLWTTLGFPADALDRLDESDLKVLSRAAAVLDGGFPLVAFLQVARVWGQALEQIADAESRLFEMYVHRPLIIGEAPGEEVVHEIGEIIGAVLPHIKPIMEYVHDRYLQQFVEQQQVANMQTTLGSVLPAPGRLTVAVAFVDMAGFTRYTEEVGEEEAFMSVERLRRTINDTLPAPGRLVKMTGDGVMVVSTDLLGLLAWNVELVERMTERPLLRIGIHVGEVLYRDGDYYGSTVNLASRVVARAAGGEVVVSDAVHDFAGINDQRDLRFTEVGEVRLKGFSGLTRLYRVEPAAS